MHFERLLKLALPLAGGDPPTEFRLLKYGENRSRKGVVIFDEKAAADVMAAYREHGIERLPFDYEHAQVDPEATPEQQKAAGNFVPALRSDGLWVTSAAWTKKAFKEIAEGEIMYFSPAFNWIPTEDGKKRPTRLINVALTNLPGLDGIPMLTAKDMRVATLSESFQDITAALEKTLRDLYPMRMLEVCEVYDDRVIWEFPGDEDRYFAQGYEMIDGKPALVGEPVEVKEVYVPVGADISADGAAMNLSESARRGSGRETSGRASAKERSLMDKTILAALSLKDDAPETEVLSHVTRLRAAESDILQLTERTTLEEAKGVVLGWRSAAIKLPELEKRVEELQSKQEADERRLFLKEFDGKFRPCELDGWVKSASMETLREYVKTAPEIGTSRQTEPQQPEVKTLALNEIERRAARAAGLTEEQFAAHKADLVARDGGSK